MKWIKDLKVRPKIIKQLGKIFEKNLLDADLVNDFLDMTPKVKQKKKKRVLINWTSAKFRVFVNQRIEE